MSALRRSDFSPSRGRRRRSHRGSDLELEAFDGAGRLLSRNALEFCLVPRLATAAPALFPVDQGAEEILTATAYPNPAASLSSADVALGPA